ncbi:hypothetical protein V865_004874 [Kwoniella europaea PYCC6329]|uniref:F-box domain-containing protein n=1 Tax=Kwoniella europaea PYCC6329 TaxID=1423913 RepID=A0AAX4KLG8_9TREE
MDKETSACERVWSIPALHDTIISLVPPECISSLALVNKAFFEPVIRHKYKTCVQHDYERVMKKCKAQERKLLYRNSIKVLRLEKSKLASHPAKWARLFDSLPNLRRVTYKDTVLSKSNDQEDRNDGKSKFTYRYIFSETLPVATNSPIKRRRGIPSSYAQEMIYNLFVPSDPMVFHRMEEDSQLVTKQRLLERIRFISASPHCLTICIPFSNLHLLDIYKKLISEGYPTPNWLTLSDCDRHLPDLINLIGEETRILSTSSCTYKRTQLTFEEFYN